MTGDWSRSRLCTGPYMRWLALGLVCTQALSGCGPQRTANRPAVSNAARTGDVVGRTFDLDSNHVVADALITLTPITNDHAGAARFAVRTTTSGDDGAFALRGVPPGQYQVTGNFANQTVTLPPITVSVEEASTADLVFALAHQAPPELATAAARASEITRTTRRPGQASALSGWVTDNKTGRRLAGAVVTMSLAGSLEVLDQVVSDAQGAFMFSDVRPATYALSTYYAVAERGQFELRRGEIVVGAHQHVTVPMFIETGR